MENGIKNREILADIRARMLSGRISVDRAMTEAQPVIDAMNEKGKEIAKQYGRKFHPLTFAYIAR